MAYFAALIGWYDLVRSYHASPSLLDTVHAISCFDLHFFIQTLIWAFLGALDISRKARYTHGIGSSIWTHRKFQNIQLSKAPKSGAWNSSSLAPLGPY